MWQNAHLSSRNPIPAVLNRVSKIFQPSNIIPKNAEVKNQDKLSKSQRLMLDHGIIKQANPGSFHLLPIGVRALNKLTTLVDREMCKIGAQKVILPSLTNAKLWKATGRLNDFGSELFTLNDRHRTTYVLSPTHEESVSDLLANIQQMSYKEFPLRLYQTTSKYRDEIKPRFGLMRGKEFIMKDLYTFDVSLESARQTYHDVCESYNNIFQRIGVDFIKVEGSCGTMGGSLSHEYHYVAPVGEDSLLTCLECNYTANTELVGSEKCPQCGTSTNFKINQGIEVGHTFLLGEKYSKSLKVNYLNEKGKPAILQMGSYGIGLSRILAATVEVLSLENEIRWPVSLAPYMIVIISPKEGSKEDKVTEGFSEKLYSLMETIHPLEGNVLLDDRKHLTIGRRMLDARQLGYPYIVVIGSKATEYTPLFELNDLQKDAKLFLSENELLSYFNDQFTI